MRNEDIIFGKLLYYCLGPQLRLQTDHLPFNSRNKV